jgi:transcriptional regulator with XRE-family HTH domain
VEVVATWTGALVGQFRFAYRQTVEEFAEKLGVVARTVSKWEADPEFTPPSSMQQILDTALDRAPDDVKARFNLLREPITAYSRLLRPRLPSDRRGRAEGDEVETAADEAEVEQASLLTEPDPKSVAFLWEEAAEIARSGNRGPREIFAACRRIHHQALVTAEHTRRPGSLSDLYVVAGQTTALMASTAFDLNRWSAAAIFARSAISYAELVDNPSLKAWTLGLAALLANWRNEPDIALDHFGHGLEVAPLGTPRVRLRFIAARSFALLADPSSVADVLDQARQDQDDAERFHDSLSEEIGGEFAFGRARAGACAAAAWLDLGRGEEAKEAAHRALSELLALPQVRQPFSQIAGARIDLATACLIQGERDEAEDALSSVLAVPVQMRNVSLSGRLAKTRQVLSAKQWSGDTGAQHLDDAIGEWMTGRSSAL